MRSTRSHVAIVLGYPIRRLDGYDETGLPQLRRFEVLDPLRATVLTSQTSFGKAKRFVVNRELRAVKLDKPTRSRSSDAA